jgi:hypothetical protein
MGAPEAKEELPDRMSLVLEGAGQFDILPVYVAIGLIRFILQNGAGFATQSIRCFTVKNVQVIS